MDVSYTLDGIEFQWNLDKAESNLKKHKISFAAACEVFLDLDFLVLNVDYVDGEERERIIGLTSNWQLLCVVYVLKEEIVRIISARPATLKERRFYENR
jgi:uncharacterized protein